MPPTGLGQAASYDVNADLTADADAAVAAATGLRLMGWTAKETDGCAGAVLDIVEGATGAGGTAIIPVILATGGSDHEWYGPEGIDVAGGLSILHTSGQATVVLFYKTVNPGV